MGATINLYRVNYITRGGFSGSSTYYAKSEKHAVKVCTNSIGHCLRLHTLSASKVNCDEKSDA